MSRYRFITPKEVAEALRWPIEGSPEPPTADEINRIHAEFWEERTPRFERIVRELPGAAARAAEEQQFWPVKYQRTLEQAMFEIDDARPEIDNLKQSEKAQKPRNKPRKRDNVKNRAIKAMSPKRQDGWTLVEFLDDGESDVLWEEHGLCIVEIKYMSRYEITCDGLNNNEPQRWRYSAIEDWWGKVT